MAIEVGNVFEGRVTGVKPFGAFVALTEGGKGMVHISEVSNEFVQDIAAVLHDGDTVKVQVINVAPDGKIALSIKRLLPQEPRAPRAPREDRGPRPYGNGPREGGHGGNRGGRFGGGQGGGRPPREGGRPAREAAPRVWQPKAPARSDNLSFEDMMSRFKSQSEEKMADLDHETNNRRGGGYAPVAVADAADTSTTNGPAPSGAGLFCPCTAAAGTSGPVQNQERKPKCPQNLNSSLPAFSGASPRPTLSCAASVPRTSVSATAA